MCFSENKTFENELTIDHLNIPKFYLKLLNEQQKTSNISYVCSKHKKEFIKFVCEEHKEFICSLCLRDHANHIDSTRIYLEEDLIEDLQKVESKLKERTLVLESLKGKLQDIRSKKIFKSQEIKEYFAEVEKFFLKPFSRNSDDENQRFPLVVQAQIFESNNKPFAESIILPQTTNREFIYSIFEEKKFICKLLFRGSRDGFSAHKFHQLCDEKGPTITIVKSQKGFYFGGFNIISWSSNQNGV